MLTFLVSKRVSYFLARFSWLKRVLHGEDVKTDLGQKGSLSEKYFSMAVAIHKNYLEKVYYYNTNLSETLFIAARDYFKAALVTNLMTIFPSAVL